MQGSVFGRLVALNLAYTGKRGKVWNCRCSCGVELEVLAYSLKSGKTKSCGCLRKEMGGTKNKSHGLSGTPTYLSWIAMRARCLNPLHDQYKDYGGRGITIDPSWDSFEQFLKDMGPRPEGKTLDRIDNDGPYSAINCRWATRAEQARNSSQTTLYIFQGEEKCLADWADGRGIPRTTLWNRLHTLKWSFERAINNDN